MSSRKKILAIPLAAAQLACSFSFGAYEAAAQIVRAPVAGISLVPSAASGSLSPLMHSPGMPQASLAPALSPSFLPAPSLIVPAAATVAAAPSAATKDDAPSEDPGRSGAAASRPMRILITGPPGAGKSTYGKMLARDFGMVHISVGELLRERAASDPALKAQMQKGELVDSDLVRGVVLARLAQPDVVARGFILDGFPRRPEEIGVIESWREAGGKLDGIVHLDAPDAELLRRIESRGRADDSPEVFRRRMEIYREQTKPVLEHFGRSVEVLEADAAEPDIETTYERVRALVERLRSGR